MQIINMFAGERDQIITIAAIDCCDVASECTYHSEVYQIIMLCLCVNGLGYNGP
jgi:hypothetical protein